MGEMTKKQKKEALRAWRQKEKKSYCLEQEEWYAPRQEDNKK